MKTFFNGTKVHAIPPDLFSCAFVTDFQEKKKYFQHVFYKAMYIIFQQQCLTE